MDVRIRKLESKRCLVCVEVRIRVVELETVDIPLVSDSELFYHSLDLEICLCKQLTAAVHIHVHDRKLFIQCET